MFYEIIFALILTKTTVGKYLTKTIKPTRQLQQHGPASRKAIIGTLQNHLH